MILEQNSPKKEVKTEVNKKIDKSIITVAIFSTHVQKWIDKYIIPGK